MATFPIGSRHVIHKSHKQLIKKIKNIFPIEAYFWIADYKALDTNNYPWKFKSRVLTRNKNSNWSNTKDKYLVANIEAHRKILVLKKLI